MGQIVRRKKKGRPPRPDPSLPPETERDVRRSLRRRNVKYVFDLDDYFDEDEVLENDEEQRRRDKKLKRLLKLQTGGLRSGSEARVRDPDGPELPSPSTFPSFLPRRHRPQRRQREQPSKQSVGIFRWVLKAAEEQSVGVGAATCRRRDLPETPKNQGVNNPKNQGEQSGNWVPFGAVFADFRAAAANNPKNLILFLADNDPSTNLSWCPDCVRAEPVILKKLEASSDSVLLLKAFVGDRPTWRNPQHPWRIDSTFKLTGVPALKITRHTLSGKVENGGEWEPFRAVENGSRFDLGCYRRSF